MGEQVKKKEEVLVARNNQTFLSTAWIETRCFGGAALQMLDAAYQMTPPAHVSETSERKRDREWGQERQKEKEECVWFYKQNFTLQAPLANIP